MSNGLGETVALVTGASSGIGEATARALAAHGATVSVVARRKGRLDALAAEVGGLAIQTDVTDREQAQAAVERTARELGRLDNGAPSFSGSPRASGPRHRPAGPVDGPR